MSKSPFELLLTIDRKSRPRARAFPSQHEVVREWVGIVFRIRRNPLVAPLLAVAEIITPPAIASVPGVKPWVLGIANMRGTLLPIMDVQGFLYRSNAVTELRTRRVLVVPLGGHWTGLLVDAVVGLKRFRVDARSEQLPELDPEVKPYVSYGYQHGDARYALMNVAALIEDRSFLDVGL
ncbi:MAG: chemotaxis protein CheW [Gammaproteobacteria bacterium]